MRAVVDAKEFSQALDKVSRVLRKWKFDHILEEATLCFSDGRCTLTGTDFETWLITEIPARGDDFSFVFHRTANVVKACRHFDGELVLELTETGTGRDRWLNLCMTCGDRAGEFRALFPEDYPEMPKLEPEYSFSVNASSLLERIERIKYATRKNSDTDMCRASIQFSGSRIYCLDGRRAAWSEDGTMSVPRPFLLLAAPLEHLKIFGKQDVSVRLGKRYADISDGTAHLILRLVEAVPFALDSAIPRQFHEEIYVSPNEFLAELAYLKELLPNREKPYVRFCGGRLLTQADGRRYQTRIQMDGRSEMEIGLNLHHMTDALRQFKGESQVRMKLTTSISPILLEAEGRNDYALVLPVQLKHVPAAG